MKYLLILLFAMLTPMLLGNPADACQYVPSNNTLQEDFEEYDFVFSGKILTVGKYVAYTPVTLEIIDQWKGEPHEKIYLFTCAGKNSGGLQFEEGKSYLIFAEKLKNNVEPIVTDFGPTKLLSDAKNDMLFLDQQVHITRFTYEPRIDQKTNYQFIDFSYANIIGEPIRFLLEKTAKNQCNSYTATITDENDGVVWTQQRGSLCVITNDLSLHTSQIKLGYDANNPIMIDKSGTYLIKVEIDDKSIEQEFIVRQNHTGISLDRTDYPVPWVRESPLKQFKSGVELSEIQCKESLIRMAKHDGSPACVKPETISKLIERGWMTELISSDSYILKYSPVLFSGTGVSLSDDTFSMEDFQKLQQRKMELDMLLEDRNSSSEEIRDKLLDERRMIQYYSQLAFDEGVPWNLVKILWEKEKKVQEEWRTFDREEFPIVSLGGVSIGYNAYSVDEQYAGKPSAINVGILEEKFTKQTLKKTDKLLRNLVGNEIDIVYYKSGYAITLES